MPFCLCKHLARRGKLFTIFGYVPNIILCRQAAPPRLPLVSANPSVAFARSAHGNIFSYRRVLVRHSFRRPADGKGFYLKRQTYTEPYKTCFAPAAVGARRYVPCTRCDMQAVKQAAVRRSSSVRAVRNVHEFRIRCADNSMFAHKSRKLHLSCTNYALCCKFRYLPKQNLLYMLLITSSCASVPVISPSFSHALRMREEMTSKVSCCEPSRRISAV